MTLEEFWSLIQKIRDQSLGDMELREDLLRKELLALSVENVWSVGTHFQDQLNRAYSWDLSGAMCVLLDALGGDDGFWDFRGALISQGKDVFERAVDDPDTLADLPEEEIESMYWEGFQQAWGRVYEDEMEGGWHDLEWAEELTGEEFDFNDEDELRRRYPRTFARCWGRS